MNSNLKLMLIVGLAGALDGCFPECTDTSPEDLRCACSITNNTQRCQEMRGIRNNEPDNGVTCSGANPTESARFWTVTMVDNGTSCVSITTRFANTQTEAVQCASGAGYTTYPGDQVCEYFVTVECDEIEGTCGSYSAFGRTQSEAMTCAEYLNQGCFVLDVTDVARPSGGCRGLEYGVSFWPCP
jgi:hypothetical protein